MSDHEHDTEVVEAAAHPPVLQPDQPDIEEGSITSASFQENQRALETIKRLKNEMLEMRQAEDERRLEAERERDNQLAAVTKHMEERMEKLQENMAKLIPGEQGVGLTNIVEPTSGRLVTSGYGPGEDARVMTGV